MGGGVKSLRLNVNRVFLYIYIFYFIVFLWVRRVFYKSIYIKY